MSYINIPFPVDRLIAQPINLQQGNFAVNLNVPMPPALAPYFGNIVTSLIDVIQYRCQENGLRTFLYNQMCQNNYSNTFFYRLVDFTANYITMMLSRGNYSGNISIAIPDCAIKTVEMFCAENLKTNVSLSSVIDPMLVDRAKNTLSIFDMVSMELNQFNNSIPGFNSPQQGYQPQQMYQPPPPSPYQQNIQQPQISGSFYGQPNQLNSPPVYNNNQFPSNFPPPNQQPTQNSSFLVKPKIIEAPPVVNQVVNIRRADDSAIVNSQKSQMFDCTANDSTGNKFKWIPTEEQPFNMAYNPEVKELCYHVVPGSNTVMPFTRELNQELLMERAKHFKSLTVPPTTSFLVGKEIDANKARSQALEKGINSGCIVNKQEELQRVYDQAVSEGQLSDLEVGDNPKFKLIADAERNIIANSDEEVWRECDIMLCAKKKQTDMLIAYSSVAFINNSLVTFESSKPLADKLLQCEDLLDVSNVLKTAKAHAIRSKNPVDDLITVNYFNRRLTDKLNQFTKNQLALAISIDSFVPEGIELIDYIQNKFGDKFSDPLRAYQGEIIRQSFTYATDSYEVAVKELFPAVPTEFVPDITYYYCLDYFISLYCFSIDLKFDVPDVGYSVAILEREVPILYKLATYVFKQIDTHKHEFNRCLIKTLDRKIFMLTRSVIDKNTFLVSVLK